MKSSKTTRRALLGSLTSLVLCFAMLIGSTFAWFTDTASTSVNTIQAGTLKVDIVDETTGNSIRGQSISFVNNTGSSEILWEPGATFRTTGFQIKNNGNLVLKYKLAINGIDGDAELLKAIEFKLVKADGTEYKEVTADGVELAANTTDSTVYYIQGKMSQEAGNECQGKTLTGVGITVQAKQAASEYDSTTDQYDAGATYGEAADNAPSTWDGESSTAPADPSTWTDNEYHISTAAELMGAMNLTNEGKTNSWAYGKTIVLDSNIDLGGATIKGFGGLEDNIVFTFDGNGYTISNFTINAKDSAHEYEGSYLYAGLFQQFGGVVKNLTVKNAKIIGAEMVGVIASNVEGNGATIENCHVVDCTVEGTKKVGGIVGYIADGTVKNCTVKNTVVTYTNKDAGAIAGYGTADDSNTATNVSVGVGVSTVTALTDVLSAANTAKTASVSVVLTDDITMSSAWTPIDIGFYGDYKNVTNLTINGNGHTVSGLTSALVKKVSGNCSVTINDLTVTGASVSNSSYTNGMGNGLLVGYTENGNVTLNNCTVKDSSISESSVAAAALIGYVSGNNTINITNCEVKNTNVTGDSAAGFIGYVQQATVTVSGCKVSGGSFTGEKSEKQGAYFGTVNIGATVNISNTTADTTALVGRILSTGAVNYN